MICSKTSSGMSKDDLSRLDRCTRWAALTPAEARRTAPRPQPKQTIVTTPSTLIPSSFSTLIARSAVFPPAITSSIYTALSGRAPSTRRHLPYVLRSGRMMQASMSGSCASTAPMASVPGTPLLATARASKKPPRRARARCSPIHLARAPSVSGRRLSKNRASLPLPADNRRFRGSANQGVVQQAPPFAGIPSTRVYEKRKFPLHYSAPSSSTPSSSFDVSMIRS